MQAFPPGRRFCLLLFIPFNLLLQLAVRDFVGYAFDRSRFRELFSVLAIAMGVVPQLLLRTGVAYKLKPQLSVLVARRRGSLAGSGRAESGKFCSAFDRAAGRLDFAWLTFWRERNSGADSCERIDSEQRRLGEATRAFGRICPACLARFFRDPMAALVQTRIAIARAHAAFPGGFRNGLHFRSARFHSGGASRRWPARSRLHERKLPAHRQPGMVFLLLSDALLLNVFGLDRQASQLFFVAPVRLETVCGQKTSRRFALSPSKRWRS